MESNNSPVSGAISNRFSRRNLFKGAAALGAASVVPAALGQGPTGAPFGTVWVYIGTYTGTNPPSAFANNGMGIYLGALNLSNGQLNILRLVAPALPATANSPATSSPSTLVIDSSGTHLYAGNEFGPPGAVSAYAINRLTGDLTLLNVQPAKGAPAHVGLGSRGKYLLAAEYSGSTFQVFPIRDDGALLPAIQTITDVGNVGPRPPTRLPVVSPSAAMMLRTPTRWMRIPRKSGSWELIWVRIAFTYGVCLCPRPRTATRR